MCIYEIGKHVLPADMKGHEPKCAKVPNGHFEKGVFQMKAISLLVVPRSAL